MTVLAGDVTGDGVVNSGDAVYTRNHSGEVADASNWRADVNLDGYVNSGDIAIVRQNAGTGLAPEQELK